MSGLSIEDILGDSPAAEALRGELPAMVASGAVDGAFCLNAARLCLSRRQAFKAATFLSPLLAHDPIDEPTRATLSAVVLTALAGPVDGNPTLGLLFSAVDRMSQADHWRAMQTLALELARRPEAAHALSGSTCLAGSESYQAARLAALAFAGDLEAAAALSFPAAPKAWSFQAQAKLAALRGDLEGAAAGLEAGLEDHPAALRAWGDLAAVQYCLGRREEARASLRRSFVGDPGSLDGPRQEEWRAQLAEAIRGRSIDGGAAGRIGAAANYTDPDRLDALWEPHCRESRSENAFRTVSGFTNRVMFAEVEKVLATRPGIRKVLNHGTLCGTPEAEFAGRRPDLTVAGFDISAEATRRNRERFSAPNLRFGSDLNGLLADLAGIPGETLMVHCRTMDVMFPEAVRRVYRAAAEAGVAGVLSAEYFAARIATFDYPDFAAAGVETLQWEGIVMIHDIPRLLAECGFRPVAESFRPVPLLVSASGEGLQPAQLIQLVLGERPGGGA